MALLLSACPSDDEQRLASRSPSSTPTAVVDDPECSDVECAALAGICQVARCDGPAGCRVSATHEGEPCLEGNVCGAAECRSGDCVPLAPPACELSDACSTGVCRPEVGCVAELRAVPGAEANPVRLSSTGVGRITASNLCHEQLQTRIACADELTGPSTFFELDLSEATELTRVHLAIDASFAFEAALTRGPSADAVVLSCAEPLYWDGKSRRISAELEPGRYHLVVTGTSVADRGPISVASAVGDPDSAAPTNDDCATPLRLDGAIEQQSVIPDLARATAQATVRCAPLASVDAFYELDLSGHSSEVLLDVDVGELDGGYFSSAALLASDSCTEILTCGKTWSRRLSPGIYKLALHLDPEELEDRFSVRVRASETSCLTTTNDRWETALDLDPTLATQRIRGNTACGNDDSSVCSGDRGAPDLFYRLDLRNHSAPQLVQLDGERAESLLNYVLVPSGDTDLLLPTRCEEVATAFVLAPRLYYLVIDGSARDAGHFDLELRLEDQYTVPRDCLPNPGPFGFGTCLQDSEPACAISIAHPDCIRAAVDCGLASDVYMTFCAAQPACCDGTAPVESCKAPWETVSLCRG